ncbi:MAG: hypothetical protein R3C28_08400 [Pirellulaceae bacterium]
MMSRRPFVCVLLLWTIAFAPALSVAQTPDSIYQLAYDDPFISVVAFPSRILADPQMAYLPLEVMQAAGEKEFGLNPLTIQSVIAQVDVPQGPPSVAVGFRLSEPFKLSQLNERILAQTMETDEDNVLGGRGFEACGLACPMTRP